MVDISWALSPNGLVAIYHTYCNPSPPKILETCPFVRAAHSDPVVAACASVETPAIVRMTMQASAATASLVNRQALAIFTNCLNVAGLR